MRTFLTAPPWALALLTGGPVGAATALLIVLTGDSRASAVRRSR
ncbi:hypothetical protein [Kribbella sp. NPDC051770]